MNKASTIYFRGRSGREYCFQVWPAGTHLKAVAGIFILTKRVFNNPTFATSASHECLGIAATDDLSTIAAATAKSAATYICVRAEPNVEERAAIEQDLIGASLRGWNALAKLPASPGAGA